MANKSYTRNESDVQRLLSQGRGQGIGEKYLPYFFVRDVPSCGRSHRIYSRVNGRVIHLLSDIEYAHCLLFDMDHSIIDIREQFALSRADTIRIAETLGYRHPKDPKSDTNAVMTTDLVVTYQNIPMRKHRAVAIKPASELAKPRIQEKLQIEKLYWVEKDIQFQILTERDIPPYLKRSLQWLRQYNDFSRFAEPTEGYFAELAKALLISIDCNRDRDLKLTKMCTTLDERLARDAGSHLMMARHLLSIRLLQTDLDREQLWNTPVSEIKLNPKLAGYEQVK